MSFFQDEQKLTQHFMAAWADNANPYKDIPVELVTEKKDPNDKGEIVRLRVKRALSGPFAIGGTRRNFGSVLVQLVGPTGFGPGRLLNAADKVAQIFAPNEKPIRIGSVRCKTPSAGGIQEEGTLATLVVDVPFSSDYSS